MKIWELRKQWWRNQRFVWCRKTKAYWNIRNHRMPLLQIFKPYRLADIEWSILITHSLFCSFLDPSSTLKRKYSKTFYASTLQNNVERSEFEARTRLGAQVETLQREVNLLKKKLESGEKHHKSIISTWEVKSLDYSAVLVILLKWHSDSFMAWIT